MDMNPMATSVEQKLFDQILPIQNRHIFTKTNGDGQINRITRKNDLSGLWVYFYTNCDEDGDSGEIRLDGSEFVADIESHRPLGWGDGE